MTASTVTSLSASTRITLRANRKGVDAKVNVDAFPIGDDLFVPIKINKATVLMEVWIISAPDTQFLIMNHDLEVLVGEEDLDVEGMARIRCVSSQNGKPAILASRRSKDSDACPIYFKLAPGDCFEYDCATAKHKRERVIVVLLEIRRGRAIFDVAHKRGGIQTRPISSPLKDLE